MTHAADEAAPADAGAFDETLANGGDMDFLALRGNQTLIARVQAATASLAAAKAAKAAAAAAAAAATAVTAAAETLAAVVADAGAAVAASDAGAAAATADAVAAPEQGGASDGAAASASVSAVASASASGSGQVPKAASRILLTIVARVIIEKARVQVRMRVPGAHIPLGSNASLFTQRLLSESWFLIASSYPSFHLSISRLPRNSLTPVSSSARSGAHAAAPAPVCAGRYAVGRECH